MAEKIKLLELDIDVNQLVKNTTDARTAVNKLKEELKLLKKEPAENAKEISILNAQLKNASSQLRENELVLAKYTDTQNVNNLTIKEARNQLAAISVLWANEAKLNGENTEASKKYAEAKLLLTERISAERSATGDSRMNVGKYSEAILEAAKNNGIFGSFIEKSIVNVQGFKTSLENAKNGFKGAAEGSSGFQAGIKGIGGAFAASGIGTIITIFSAIITILQKYKPVADKVEQVTAAIGAVIQEVTNRVGKFVEGFKSILSGNFSKGIDEMSNSVDNLGDSLVNTASKAMELKKAQQDLEDSQKFFELTNAKAQQQIEQLLLQSKNRTLSEKERLTLLDKASKLEQQNYLIELSNAEEAARIAREQLKLASGLNDAQIKEIENNSNNTAVLAKYTEQLDKAGDALRDGLIKANTELVAVQRDSIKVQETINNRYDALEEKRQAKAEAYRKKLEEDEKKREESLKKKNELIIKEMEQQLRLQQALSERNKVDIVNDDTFQKEELRLANAFIAEKELLDKKYETEKNLSKGSKEELLEIETRHKADLAELNNKYNDITEANLKTLSEKAQAFFDAELENFKKVQQDKIDAANKANDLLTSRREEDRLRIATDYENELEIRRLNGENTLNLRQEQLDRERDIELQAAEGNAKSRNLIFQKYELAKAAIAKEVQRAQLGSLADGLGQISELLGKNTAAGKAAGIAQATINTYLGVSQVLAAPPSGPEPLNTITKAIAIATTIGNGIANVANIVRVPTKFESGGKAATAGGNRHSSGGTKYYGEDGNVVELEQGENWYVLNRNASSAIGRLSDINQRYGGVSFHTANNSGFYEEGGLVGDGGLLQRSLTGGDIAGVVLQAVDTAFRNVTIVTKVTDVISETGKYNSLVDGANI